MRDIYVYVVFLASFSRRNRSFRGIENSLVLKVDITDGLALFPILRRL